jgi:hypothetical protein
MPADATPPSHPPPCSGHACRETPETVTIIQSPKSPARNRCAMDRRMLDNLGRSPLKAKDGET